MLLQGWLLRIAACGAAGCTVAAVAAGTLFRALSDMRPSVWRLLGRMVLLWLCRAFMAPIAGPCDLCMTGKTITVGTMCYNVVSEGGGTAAAALMLNIVAGCR